MKPLDDYLVTLSTIKHTLAVYLDHGEDLSNTQCECGMACDLWSTGSRSELLRRSFI